MPTQQPPPQEYARFVLIVILLFFLYTSPDQGAPAGFQSPHDYAADRIDRFRHALNVLNRTKWQDFSPKTADKSRYEAARYLNLTGFRENDDYAWERVDAFKTKSQEFTEEAKLGSWPKDTDNGPISEVYQNVTGIVQGKWVRNTADLNGVPRTRSLNLTETSPVVDWAFRDVEYWTRNITGTEGKMMLRLEESDTGAVNVYPDTSRDPKLPIESGTVAREVAATLTIQDESSTGDGWDMRLHGVHWPKQGVLLLTSTSEKFSGIFGLPHLTMNSEQFKSSQRLLNVTLEREVESLEKSVWIDLSNPWSSSPDSPGDATMPVPHCEYVVYVQVYPMSLSSTSLGSQLDPTGVINAIEQELRFPNGAPIPVVPSLKMSTVIFSPDCGFMLESKGPPSFVPADGTHLNGKKHEMFLQDIQKWLRAFAAVVFGQILLLKAQSKEASTPSTVGRVSLYTIAMMLMADALLFSSLSLLSATAPNLFPSALLTSFSALMSVALGVRFISAVYSVQEPERREALRAQLAAEAASRPTPIPRPVHTHGAAPAVTPIITAVGVEVASQPRATPTPPRPVEEPIIVPSDQDFNVEIEEGTSAATATPLLPTTNRPAAPQIPRATSSFGAAYIKFVLSLTFILFLSLSAISWSIPFRTGYIHIVSFTYLSFWLPQIRRNVIRNCRKALLWKFVIGQSMLRLLPFAYFYLREDNILFAETDWKAFCALASWVWVQILLLAAQEILGPRWALPKSWYEEGWNYHPILSEDNVESGGLPIGLVKAPGSPTLDRVRTSEDMGSGSKKDGNTRSVDCAICMQLLEVPVVAAGVSTSGTAGSVVEMLARRQYMVTPCKHIFHSACLEGWMRFRLQCPICRENLPPL
ncbi:RING finger ubiquitin ligase-like protein [Rhexocercosporidium sp. MPI-PUGE-AT-0058]|nr:RING finger ubiquitin ligase-like protein [Rhexocercosporidium sp. MPI-PUGE-AT-0058]